jgi:hypothetical protein
MFKLLGVLGLVAVVIVIVALGPLAVLWSLNQLFGLHLTYTVWNWLAALVLMSLLQNTVKIKK